MLPSISSVGFSNSVETREETPFKTPDKMNFEVSINHINDNYSGLWDQMLDKNLSKSKIEYLSYFNQFLSKVASISLKKISFG